MIGWPVNIRIQSLCNYFKSSTVHGLSFVLSLPGCHVKVYVLLPLGYGQHVPSPPGATGVGGQDFELGEVDSHIFKMNGMGILGRVGLATTGMVWKFTGTPYYIAFS